MTELSPIDGPEFAQNKAFASQTTDDDDDDAKNGSSSDSEEEDDDEDEDEDEDNDNEKQIESRLDQALDECIAKVPKYDFTTAEGYAEFSNVYTGVLDKHVKNNMKGNILHQIVRNGADKYDHIGHALAAIVEHYYPLLDEVEGQDSIRAPLGPVFLAVQQDKPRMVSAMIKGFQRLAVTKEKKDVMRRVLCKLAEGETCLHFAIRNNLRESAIQALVSMATEDVLSIQDNQGRTVLHHAVKYEDCGISKRAQTVQMLLQMANDSLTLEDHAKRSVFVHHVETRKQFNLKLEFELARQKSEEEAAEKRGTDPSEKLELKTGLDKHGDRPKETDDTRSPAPPKDPKSAEKQQSRSGRTVAKPDAPSREGPTTLAYNAQKDDPKVLTQGMVRPNQSARREYDLPMTGISRTRTDHFPENEQKAASRNNSQTRRREIELQKEEERKRTDMRREDQRKIEEDKVKKALQENKRKKRSKEEKEESKRRRLQDPVKLEARSAEIQMDIKLNCMRKRSPEETSRILYGKNPNDVQLYFDFAGPPSVMMRMFKKTFEHVKFDPVLQYVAFPSVKVEEKVDDTSISRRSLGAGRRDMVQFFNWLRKDKKVTRIMKVIVDDSQQPAHSDEAIIEALRDFHVEELHWLKTDLDPITIRTASSEIRELKLRWSGSNATLRGWGEPDGLPKLENLSTLYIELVHELNLESEERTKKSLSAFKKRLNSGETSSPSMGRDETDGTQPGSSILKSRKINVKSNVSRDGFYSTSGRGGDGSASKSRGLGEDRDHQWLDSMDNFAQDLNSTWEYAKKLKGAQQLASPVTVALIDDGVDLVDPSFQDRLYEGKSLSFDLIGENDPKTSQRVHSYHHSEGGHGTVMANLIFRVCPMAKLYIIRIETHRNREGQSRFVTRSAAEAIRAAIDKKVNIISMSWTVAMDLAKPSDDMKDLQSAVQAAHDAKVLMFCSSSDGGQFVEETLPASGNRDHVFRIGAASADGTPFSWAGPVEKLDYILPGVDVVKRRPGHGRGRLLKEKMEEMKSDTGSSVATALAAGLAAMVLTCVKMAAMHTASAPEQHKLGVTEDMVQQLQEHVKMKAALDNLDLTPNKYLQVWFKLNTSQISRGVRFSDSGESEKLERISNMVLTKGFVSKIT